MFATNVLQWRDCVMNNVMQLKPLVDMGKNYEGDGGVQASPSLKNISLPLYI